LKEVIGQNLKSARESAQISQDDFAQKLGISRATLSAIENGHSTIDSTKLLEAARLLGRPVSEFFSERIEETALLYRAAENTIAPEHARKDFERFCRAYRELEEIVEVADSVLPPPEYAEPQFADVKAFAELVAASERQRLGIGPLEPINNMFKVLDEQGVRIFLYPLDGHDVWGISAYSARFGACIFVNALTTVERRIFSLAHEYGHLVMHRRMFNAPAPKGKADKTAELMADAFAANFLVPADALRTVFHRDIGEKAIGPEDIVFLKRYFRVSAKVIYKRLLEIKLLKENGDLLRAVTGEDQTKEIAPLGDDLIADWRRVGRFEHLAKKASLEEIISLGKLAEILGGSALETRKKVQEWRKELTIA